MSLKPLSLIVSSFSSALSSSRKKNMEMWAVIWRTQSLCEPPGPFLTDYYTHVLFRCSVYSFSGVHFPTSILFSVPFQTCSFIELLFYLLAHYVSLVMNSTHSESSSLLRRYEFYDRSFIYLGDSNGDTKKPSIRVMQWNILAQGKLKACTRFLSAFTGFVPLDEFVHCPSAVLDVESRCSQIAAEIHRFTPDVVCLQEADVHEQVLRHLNKDHDMYELQFRPKDNSPCLGIPNNMGPDGVAIIFR